MGNSRMLSNKEIKDIVISEKKWLGDEEYKITFDIDTCDQEVGVSLNINLFIGGDYVNSWIIADTRTHEYAENEINKVAKYLKKYMIVA